MDNFFCKSAFIDSCWSLGGRRFGCISNLSWGCGRSLDHFQTMFVRFLDDRARKPYRNLRDSAEMIFHQNLHQVRLMCRQFIHVADGSSGVEISYGTPSIPGFVPGYPPLTVKPRPAVKMRLSVGRPLRCPARIV